MAPPMANHFAPVRNRTESAALRLRIASQRRAPEAAIAPIAPPMTNHFAPVRNRDQNPPPRAASPALKEHFEIGLRYIDLPQGVLAQRPAPAGAIPPLAPPMANHFPPR